MIALFDLSVKLSSTTPARSQTVSNPLEPTSHTDLCTVAKQKNITPLCNSQKTGSNWEEGEDAERSKVMWKINGKRRQRFTRLS